jgi:hypothetical protein
MTPGRASGDGALVGEGAGALEGAGGLDAGDALGVGVAADVHAANASIGAIATAIRDDLRWVPAPGIDGGIA